MNRFFGTEHSPGHLDGTVGDHLIGVHVALGAAAGLPDAEREVVVEFPRDDLVGGTADELGLLGGELAKITISQGARFLELPERLDELRRFRVVADVKVDE